MLTHLEGDQFRELSFRFGGLSRNQIEIGEAGIQLMIHSYALGKFLGFFVDIAWS